MDITRYVAQIAERIAPTNRPGSAALLLALLHELVKARPVSLKTLASALGWPDERVTAVLEGVQAVEYDDAGSIVGYVLTLRETAHALEIDGERLYTWCALDTLIIPAVLGKPARVISHCPSSRAPIVLTVRPDAIENADPPAAALTLVSPGSANDIRRSFCCHVHFFASGSAADAWTSGHAATEVASLREASRLARKLAAHLLRIAVLGTNRPARGSVSDESPRSRIG
jgi:alkylmercury lyase